MRSVSTALQAAVYCVFASIIIGIAFSISASLSTYMWHTPSACPITGIWVLSMIYLTNAFEPLGIRRSTKPSQVSSSSISLCCSTCNIHPSGKPASSTASYIIPKRIRLVNVVSFPPLRTGQFPLLIQSEDI